MTPVMLNRGDIVRLRLAPVMTQQESLALILTTAVYNTTGLAVVVPILQDSNHARHAGFAVSLARAATRTKGVVVCSQVRTVNLEACGAEVIESVSDGVMGDVLARVQTLFD